MPKEKPECKIKSMVVAGWACACGKQYHNNDLRGKSDEDLLIDNGLNWIKHRDARIAKEAA